MTLFCTGLFRWMGVSTGLVVGWPAAHSGRIVQTLPEGAGVDARMLPGCMAVFGCVVGCMVSVLGHCIKVHVWAVHVVCSRVGAACGCMASLCRRI